MKKLLIAFILATITILSSNTPAQAKPYCQYDSTQARVQKDITDPWKKSIELECGESFNVGSFHDETGQFAPDTKIAITGGDYTGKPFYTEAINGQAITLPRYAKGSFSVKVTTPGQTGYACQETARVYVSCDKPQSCQYENTQARVQKDISDPWKKSLEVSCGETFNVGSFHNHTGQFAPDTTIILSGTSRSGNYVYKSLENGESTSVAERGSYAVTVATDEQYGSACRASASVRVKC